MKPSVVLASLLTLLAACGPDGDDDVGPGACDANLVPGDLVLTEVMANPTGDDDGSEWFEIYNAGSGALDLTGVVLLVTKSDGTGEKLHTMQQVVVMPGDFLVVGDVLPELKPAYVDYGYANDLGSLVNGGGVIALRCGDAEIDSLEYPEAPGDGITTILDGNIAPDHLANDDLANLCESTAVFATATGVTGSPGEANEACNVIVPGTCSDGGEARAVVSPVAGDLVITEFLANPSGVDGPKEWFEVLATATVDLNGVNAGTTPGTPNFSVVSPDCATVAAGSYLLFAHETDALLNGGLPEVEFAFNFDLKNGMTTTGPGSLFVGVGDTLLDQVTWLATVDGASTALKPDQLDPTANDDSANFVTCEAVYGTGGDTGTPGASNDTCTTPEGQCDSGGAIFRPIVSPVAGDLVITEALMDTAGTGNDPAQEWFEVEVVNSVDLNGLEIGKVTEPYTVSETLAPAVCMPAAAGTRLIFAHNSDMLINGGLPVVDQLFSMSLTNSNSAVFVGHGGAVISVLRWATGIDDGRARALNPDGLNVCDAVDAYGAAGNFGTPGAVNTAVDPVVVVNECAAPL